MNVRPGSRQPVPKPRPTIPCMPLTARLCFPSALLLAALAALPACDDKGAAPIGRLPTPPSAQDVKKNRGNPGDLSPVTDDFEYLYEDKNRGRSTLLRAAHSEPGTQGTQVLTRPQAIIALAQNRILVLTAASAQFTMPGNQPRDGRFTGTPQEPVVFTLFECPPGRAPDLTSPKDVQMKVYFDEDARFDLESDEVRSAGPVQLTGPAMDFRGAGLQLTWNRLDQRMEQLDIAHGRVLRYRSDAPLAKKDKAAPAGSPAAPAAGDKPATPPVRYHAVLSGAIQGRMDAPDGADAVRLEGAALEAIFSLAAPKPEADKPAAAPPKATLGWGAYADIALAGPVVPVRSAAEKREDQRSLFQSGLRDLTLRWDGPLQLRPSEEAQGGEDTLTLAGSAERRAKVETGRGGIITGDSLTYAKGSGRVAAKGSAEAPVSLATPEGFLTGTRMDLDPGVGKAYVFGPGRLEGRVDAAKAAATGKEAKTTAPSEPLRVTYTDHIEADFSVSPAKAGDTPRLGAPVETRLYGQVQASHPDFRLGCGKLAIGFEQVAPEAGGRRAARTSPNRIDATEEATIMLRDPKQGEVQVKSPAVRLTLEDAHGKPAPNQLAAAGPVEVTQGDGSKLTCNRLDVGFTHPAKAAEKPAVAVITATGQAHYAGLANGKPSALHADTVAVDTLKGTLSLLGTAGKPASIETDGMGLSGPKVDLEKEGGIARVDGPGRLTVVMQPKDGAGKAPEHLAVSWQGRMGWNDAKGRGYFEKQVDCAADSAQGASTLHAEDSLELRVDPAPAAKADKQADKGPAKSLKRDIRLADARGKVAFTASQLDAAGNPAGRVCVSGPNLLLKNEATPANPGAEQTVAVTGKGNMMVENFARKEKKDGAGNGAFAGRGATSFQWDKSMRMDVAQSDLHLLNNVQIQHAPLGDDNAYKWEDSAILNCQEAHADLTEGGGLSLSSVARSADAKGKTAKEKTAVELRQLKCDFGVSLRQKGERINCDHLLFTQAKQSAELWSKPPRLVELFAKGQEAPATADRVIWHTDTNRLDVDHPAGGMLPQWK